MRLMLLALLPFCCVVRAAAEPPPADLCVDVRVGGDWAGHLACLNAALRSEVAAARRTQGEAAAASLGAGSDPTRLGLFNEAATAERLGDAFGHSVIPQRPDDQYASPLVRPR
jgi:hypothetical protein